MADAQELCATGLRHQLLSRRQGHRPDRGETAGVDLAGLVGNADHLPDFNSAGHPQSHPQRQRLRCMDQHRNHHRLRHAGISVRHSVDRGVCRRQLCQLVPGAGHCLGQLRQPEFLRQDRRLPVAHGAARIGTGDRRFCHADHPYQKQFPQRNQPPVCGDRAGQGPDRAPCALRPCDAQRHVAGGGRDSPGPDRSVLCRFTVD